MTVPEQAERRAKLAVVCLDSAVLNHPAALSAGLRAMVAHLGERTGLDREALLSLTPFRGRLPTPDDVHAVLGHPALAPQGGRQRGPGVVAEAYAVYARERRRATLAFRGLPDSLRGIRAALRDGKRGAEQGDVVFVSSLPPAVLAARLDALGLAEAAGAAYSLRLSDDGQEEARTAVRAVPGDRTEGGPAVYAVTTDRPGLGAATLSRICRHQGIPGAEAILVTGRLLPDLTAARAAGLRAVLCRFDRPAGASNIEDISMTRDWIHDMARRHAARAAMPPEPYAIVTRPQDLAALPCFSGPDREPPRAAGLGPGLRLVISNRSREGR